MSAPATLPVTVLTGFLGAGKTTLLNRILAEDHGRRYAVLVNEFGEIGIDGDLILNSDEELFEMNNGCVCCTVRGDLIRTLHELLARRERLARPFDAIVLETTGLADPGPVAQTFFVDALLAARLTLDSIVTVVDARHVGLRLADSREAAEQIAFADRIVLNKTDLADEPELAAIEARLRSLNPLATIHRARRADVPLDRVLGQGGFDLERIVALEPEFLAPDHVHDEHCGHEAHHDHRHDSGIESVSLSTDRPLDRAALEAWLADLVARRGADILRAKGILALQHEPRRFVFQAVHMLHEAALQQPWNPEEPRTSRLVFIGRHLDAEALQAGLSACVAH